MISKFLASEDTHILGALKVIDDGGAGLCCIVDNDDRFLGVVTDGDLRRALIAGAELSDPVALFIQRDAKTVPVDTPRAHILDLMTALSISTIPEVTTDGHVAAVHTLNSIVGRAVLPNRAVIMAGGKGTRLGELTRHIPKPLMAVAGRPIIEWIILLLTGAGIRNISVSVNHFSEQIEDKLGDGSQYGCSIEYLRETADNPLGTAGSLTLLDPQHTSSDAPPLLVLNADILVEFDVAEVFRAHASSSAAMTMGVKQYRHTVPFGVVEFGPDNIVSGIAEKPDLEVMINTAIYCIDAELVRLLPFNEPSTMPELIQICLDSDRRVNAWNIDSDWIDIGTPEDLAKAKGTAL